jgi:hypothetical protein
LGIYFYEGFYAMFSSSVADSFSAVFKRRTLLQGVALAAVLPTAHSANAQQLPLAVAINRTARFRALSQRCTKAYAQAYLGVMPEAARQVLATAQQLIQVGFDDLDKASFGKDVAEQVGLIRVEVGKFNALLAVAPKQDNLMVVSGQSDKILLQANKTVEMLQALSKSDGAQVVSLAGRQRMLSQRMAKNYFLMAANAAPATAQEQIRSDRKDFKTALDTLNKSSITTSAIKAELELTAAQWFFFEQAIAKPSDPEALKNVATTSERLLEVANKVTLMYELALKDSLGSV